MKNVFVKIASFCIEVEEEYPRLLGMFLNMLIVAILAFIFLEAKTATPVAVLFNIFSLVIHIFIEGETTKEVLEYIGETFLCSLYIVLIIVGLVIPIVIFGIIFG